MDMRVQARRETVDPLDRALIEAVQDGLPLVSRPYQVVGERVGLSEPEVIGRLGALLEQGVIKRLGVVVRHRRLGYRANAMVVWDVPDARVRELGHCLGEFPFVTLCYRRPRRLPDWPYNLFTMIHGRDRAAVLQSIDEMVRCCGLQSIPHQALFSPRCFKQRGARYSAPADRLAAPDAAGCGKRTGSP